MTMTTTFFWFLYVSMPDARLLEVYITSTLTGMAGEGGFLSSHDGKVRGQWSALREGIMSFVYSRRLHIQDFGFRPSA